MDDMRLNRWATSAASPKPATACRRFIWSAFSGKLCEARQLWTMVRARDLSRGEADESTRVTPASFTWLRVCSGTVQAMTVASGVSP